MADQRGLDGRGIFGFLEQRFQSAGGSGEKEGFNFTHLLDFSLGQILSEQ